MCVPENGIKKKLLIIPSWYPTDVSPVNGIFIEDQAVVLSKYYDVMVYYPVPLTLRRSLKFLGQIKAEKRRNTECQQGVPLQRKQIPIFGLLYRWFWQWYLREARLGFKKVLSEWGKPDLIHAHVVLPNGWVAMKLGHDYGIPVFLTEHTGPFSAHLTSADKERLVHETLNGVNRVAAVSPALVEAIHNFCPSVKIDVVGNVIRTDLFAPLLDQSPAPLNHPVLRFLSVGLWNDKKGLDYLLKATQLLLKRGIPNFELVIGGDGPALRKLRIMAESLGVSGKCRFLGMLTRNETRHQMQQCDVFVLPSLGETFGIVLGEAMACGKPVIATRCGGPEFIVTPETGVLVNVADPVDLADAMEGFISGQYRFDAFKVSRSVEERFGTEAFVSNVSTIYQQMST